MRTNATLIAGPTASGKSAHAIEIAREKDGVIINADSMQVYDVLSVLTARPDANELSQAPHYMYGYLPPSAVYSTGHWLKDIGAVLSKIDDNRHVVFVGGTGLYFKALLGGLSPMPEVEESVRQYWRSLLDHDGAEQLHKILSQKDAAAADAIKPADGQRIVRALEIFEASGKSIIWWQQQNGVALVDAKTADCRVLTPDRVQLHERINVRFDQMIELGALEEVELLRSLNVAPDMPAMKAIGVHQLISYLNGDLKIEEAVELSKIATRQYAKRQMTWFRNQFDENWQNLSV